MVVTLQNCTAFNLTFVVVMPDAVHWNIIVFCLGCRMLTRDNQSSETQWCFINHAIPFWDLDVYLFINF